MHWTWQSTHDLPDGLCRNWVGWATQRGCTEVPHSSRPVEQWAGYHTFVSESLLRIWTAWHRASNKQFRAMKDTCLFSKLECLISTYIPAHAFYDVNRYAFHENDNEYAWMTWSLKTHQVLKLMSRPTGKVPVSHASLQESSAVHWHCWQGRVL